MSRRPSRSRPARVRKKEPPSASPAKQEPPSQRAQGGRQAEAPGQAEEPAPAGRQRRPGRTGRQNRAAPKLRHRPPPAAVRRTPPSCPGEPKDKPKASAEPTRSWFDQLRHGLARTSNALSDNLAGALTKRKLDEDTLDRIEEVLIKADLGVAMAARIRSAIARGRYDRGLDPDTVRDIVAAEIASVLEPVAGDFAFAPGASPHVFLVVGVNGTGKTTTIGQDGAISSSARA